MWPIVLVIVVFGRSVSSCMARTSPCRQSFPAGCEERTRPTDFCSPKGHPERVQKQLISVYRDPVKRILNYLGYKSEHLFLDLMSTLIDNK